MIKNDAKKIIKHMLTQAISLGDLNENFIIRDDTLAKELSLESENYCCVCCQYLHALGYIHIIENNNGDRLVCLSASGIDFLESI